MPRKTPQRTAIRAVVEDAGRPLSPQEILAAAGRKAPGLGIATVYRSIKELVDEGWLATVELPGEPARYEREGKAHHHHFRCRGCDRVFEVNKCAWSAPAATVLPAGFKVERHEVILYGLCDRCAA